MDSDSSTCSESDFAVRRAEEEVINFGGDDEEEDEEETQDPRTEVAIAASEGITTDEGDEKRSEEVQDDNGDDKRMDVEEELGEQSTTAHVPDEEVGVANVEENDVEDEEVVQDDDDDTPMDEEEEVGDVDDDDDKDQEDGDEEEDTSTTTYLSVGRVKKIMKICLVTNDEEDKDGASTSRKTVKGRKRGSKAKPVPSSTEKMLISKEAIYLTAAATELFITLVAEVSGKIAVSNKKKTMTADHLKRAMSQSEAYEFLEGCFEPSIL